MLSDCRRQASLKPGDYIIVPSSLEGRVCGIDLSVWCEGTVSLTAIPAGESVVTFSPGATPVARSIATVTSHEDHPSESVLAEAVSDIAQPRVLHAFSVCRL